MAFGSRNRSRPNARSKLQDIRIMGSLLPGAERYAHADGQDRPGAEYLLLAALDLDDGSARRVFQAVGLDPDAFHDAIRKVHSDALGSVGVDASDFESRLQTPTDRPTGVYRSEPSLQDAFKRVVDRVRSDGSQLFGAYIVESVAEAEFGTAVRALAAMGVDPLVVRQAATEEIDRINKR